MKLNHKTLNNEAKYSNVFRVISFCKSEDLFIISCSTA